MGSTDSKVPGSDKVIKLVLSDDKVIGTLLRDVYGMTSELDFGTDMGSLDGSFNGSNDDKLEVLFLQVHWDLQMVR